MQVVHVDLLVHNISQLITMAGSPEPRRGAAMRDVASVEDGILGISDGTIVAAGPAAEFRGRLAAERSLDAEGCAVVPGFVDPHTHLPWVGDRAGEFEMRIGGATYMEIMNAGGGIARTVNATRQAPLESQIKETKARLQRMLAHGTTTAEAKTGYGLETATELKQLDAIAALLQQQPVELVPTFLGAHAVPPGYPGGGDAFTDLLVHEMIPAAAERWQQIRHSFPSGWPIFCDVFCERGAFDLEQSRRILEAAHAHGFELKMHVDEFEPLGGALLAVELGCRSADHLVTTPPEHVTALARSGTIAVSLPGTPFGLGQCHYSPGRAIIDEGGALALATDLNPGTCWCESMQLMMALACRYMRLLPAEALAAATINAAHAIGVAQRVGSLEAGKQADFLILDGPDYRALPYRFGTNQVKSVFKKGTLVAQAGSSPASSTGPVA